MKASAKGGRLPATVLLVFGAAGDLAYRKLLPALFDLSQDEGLPEDFSVIAVDRHESGDDKLRRRYREGVMKFSRQGKDKAGQWAKFAARISHLKGDFSKPQVYAELGRRCAGLDKAWGGKAQRVFYMATPPSMFGVIPARLGKAGLARDRERARIVVEKPFGYDLDSARALNGTLSAHFSEKQIFRIDHYLGKETVQNILAFRFANPIFEPLWNRRYVDYVTITAAETVGIGHRGGYYDRAGALRDMVQNHLMQLLCLVAMEPIVSFDADEIRNKKVDVLHAIRPIPRAAVRNCAVRGQYGRGALHGKRMAAYRREADVSARSNTETFVALKLFVDNWRWAGVPFYLRTGKRMPLQSTQVVIQFRPAPHRSFPLADRQWHPTRLVLSIQPQEGITLEFQAKYPGEKMLLRPVDMRFNYADSFAVPSPEAYQTLLWDVMNKDPTLFMRADQIDAAWRLLAPLQEVWAASKPGEFPNYAAGAWGPKAADDLLAREGHRWNPPA